MYSENNPINMSHTLLTRSPELSNLNDIFSSIDLFNSRINENQFV